MNKEITPEDFKRFFARKEGQDKIKDKVAFFNEFATFEKKYLTPKPFLNMESTPQKVGNCTYASIKLAVKAATVSTFVGKEFNTKIINDLKTKAIKHYKKGVAYSKDSALDTYIRFHTSKGLKQSNTKWQEILCKVLVEKCYQGSDVQLKRGAKILDALKKSNYVSSKLMEDYNKYKGKSILSYLFSKDVTMFDKLMETQLGSKVKYLVESYKPTVSIISNIKEPQNLKKQITLSTPIQNSQKENVNSNFDDTKKSLGVQMQSAQDKFIEQKKLHISKEEVLHIPETTQQFSLTKDEKVQVIEKKSSNSSKHKTDEDIKSGKKLSVEQEFSNEESKELTTTSPRKPDSKKK